MDGFERQAAAGKASEYSWGEHPLLDEGFSMIAQGKTLI